jgi:hypothetical protein
MATRATYAQDLPHGGAMTPGPPEGPGRTEWAPHEAWRAWSGGRRSGVGRDSGCPRRRRLAPRTPRPPPRHQAAMVVPSIVRGGERALAGQRLAVRSQHRFLRRLGEATSQLCSPSSASKAVEINEIRNKICLTAEKGIHVTPDLSKIQYRPWLPHRFELCRAADVEIEAPRLEAVGSGSEFFCLFFGLRRCFLRLLSPRAP